MTNGELIDKLKQLPSKDEATVWIRTYTQAHSVAHATPFSVDHMGMWIALPQGTYVSVRKTAEA